VCMVRRWFWPSFLVKKLNPLGCHLDFTLIDAGLHMLIVYPVCSIASRSREAFDSSKLTVLRVVVGNRSMGLLTPLFSYFCKACSVQIWFLTSLPFTACVRTIARVQDWSEIYLMYMWTAWTQFDVHAHLCINHESPVDPNNKLSLYL
jgi:hypothetical protein